MAWVGIPVLPAALPAPFPALPIAALSSGLIIASWFPDLTLRSGGGMLYKHLWEALKNVYHVNKLINE